MAGTNDAVAYMEKLTGSGGLSAVTAEQMMTAYNASLWHQLTEIMVTWFRDVTDGKVVRADLAEFYRGFIASFETKINPTSLASLVGCAAEQACKSSPPSEQEVASALAILDEAMNSDAKKKILGEGACLLLENKKLALRLLAAGSTLDSVASADFKAELDARKADLEGLSSFEASQALVQGSYYRAAAAFYRLAGPRKDFYQNALMFLAYTPMDELTSQQKVQWAKDVSIAAIVAEGVYNFGDVLANSILSVLKGTDDEWLLQMLEAFNHGDQASFAKIVSEKEGPILAADEALSSAAVRQKLSLLCVIGVIFNTPADQRTISFADIAKATALSIDEVELVLMKSISLGLIKGVIDQVSQNVIATWVRPRVLDNVQLESLRGRMEEWQGKVGQTLHYVQDQTPDMF